MRLHLAIWLWLLPLLAWAGGETEVRVERERGLYRVGVDTHIAAPPERVLAALQDYEHLGRLHKSVLSARVLERHANGARVRVQMEGCAAFFCTEINQVLDYEANLAQLKLVATIDPAESDFRSGFMRWEVTEASPERSRLRYQAELEPEFWVPPVLGGWMLKKFLRRVALEMTESINALVTDP